MSGEVNIWGKLGHLSLLLQIVQNIFTLSAQGIRMVSKLQGGAHCAQVLRLYITADISEGPENFSTWSNSKCQTDGDDFFQDFAASL